MPVRRLLTLFAALLLAGSVSACSCQGGGSGSGSSGMCKGSIFKF